jgi:hypothetical protein
MRPRFQTKQVSELQVPVGVNRPLKMIANALRVAFHRIAYYALPQPVGLTPAARKP